MNIRRIDHDEITSELNFVDRLTVIGNPLYQQTTNAGENPNFVAE